MAKLQDKPIDKSDLITFLDGYSDFSFEIQTLKLLLNAGFKCDHGGSYEDAATKKPRQFDLRAMLCDHHSYLRLAVECKNLRENFPLLVSCVPRRREEAFYEVVFSVNSDKWLLGKRPSSLIPALLPISRSIRLTHNQAIYEVGGPVGKSCDQVGLAPSGDIVASDSGAFEKWAQALSSADDLTARACNDGMNRTRNVALSAVFPLLVVPNGRLWVTSYDEQGNRIADPEQADRCSYFVNREYYHQSPSGGDEMTISHLEIVTTDGLTKFIGDICGDQDRMSKTFPWEDIAELVPDLSKY